MVLAVRLLDCLRRMTFWRAFTTENAILTTTSNDDGSFSFANIPYGTWYIREISQPTGYVLNDTVYDVTIAEDEQVVEISIENRLIRGNITLTKVDADYPENKLTGAEFEVYKDMDGNGKLDDGDELLGKLTETDTGIYTMNDLLYGQYLVKETKAPDGFVLDTGVYSVNIETDGKTYSVENKAGIGFINEAQKGSLKSSRHLLTVRSMASPCNGQRLRSDLCHRQEMVRSSLTDFVSVNIPCLRSATAHPLLMCFQPISR